MEKIVVATTEELKDLIRAVLNEGRDNLIKNEMKETVEVNFLSKDKRFVASGSNSPPRFLTVPELCALLRICKGTAHKMIREGVIESKRSRGKRLIEQSAVDKYLDGLTLKKH